MDSYEIDTIKIEKQKAMRRYRTFRKIATVVRTLEFVIAITLIPWLLSSLSNYVPPIAEFSGAYLRRFCSFLLSPLAVFILGNAIVITLFAKSGDWTSSSENLARDVFSGEVLVDDVAVIDEVVVPERKINYNRTRSSLEVMIVEETKNKELRRSETAPIRRKIVNGNSTAANTRIGEVEKLSSDDFRRKVEEFIEKHQRLQREECKSVVVFNNHHCNSL